MKIGICGMGFVGKAVYYGFRDLVEDIYVYDVNPNAFDFLKKEYFNVKHPIRSNISGLVINSDIIFVCVPTPTDLENFKIDTSIVENVVKELSYSIEHECHRPTVIIKSTIIPGTTEELQLKYPNVPLVFSPEFLTEKNYIEDFRNQEYVIVGTSKTFQSERENDLVELFKHLLKHPTIKQCSATEAEMIKYMVNCTLATKVSLFNEFYQICKKLGIDFEVCRKLTCLDGRIGSSHTKVPGPDGDLGFGGKCLPKDVCALIGLQIEHLLSHNTLIGAWLTNSIIRQNQDWLKIPGAIIKKDSKNG